MAARTQENHDIVKKLSERRERADNIDDGKGRLHGCGGGGCVRERYAETFPRSFFVSPRRRFPSTNFAFVPRERLAF